MSIEDINEELMQIVRDMRDAQVKTADNVEYIRVHLEDQGENKELNFDE